MGRTPSVAMTSAAVRSSTRNWRPARPWKRRAVEKSKSRLAHARRSAARRISALGLPWRERPPNLEGTGPQLPDHQQRSHSGDESGQGSVSKLGHSLWGPASLRAAASLRVVEQDRRNRRAPASRVLLPAARCSASVAPSRAARSVGGESKTWRHEITAPDSFDRPNPGRSADRADPNPTSVPQQAATVDLQRSRDRYARQCATPLRGRTAATFQETTATSWAESKSQS